MSPHTFIFIGRSGCGKGTQVKLLDTYLKAADSETPVFHIETGQDFRDFIAHDGYTNTLSKNIMLGGHRQPDFLAVWMWTKKFVDELKGNEHMILDGISRSLEEARILENALGFYKRAHVHVIYINVSRAWSERHLLARGRADDKRDDISERLDWYEKDVVPAIEFYKTHPLYHFLDINGEQTVEEVHREIVRKLTP